MKRAAVTGAGGFLGRRVVSELRRAGWWVRAVTRPGGRPCPEADESVEADLRQAGALQEAIDSRLDCIVHAGARVATHGAWEEFYETNVAATERLLRIAREKGAGRVVHVSSLSVYAIPGPGAVIDEDAPFDSGGARGGYARSKREADRIVCEAIAQGADAVVVRPGLLYGCGRRPPLARRAVAVGPLRLLLCRPDYLLPLSFVDNVALAVRLAAERPQARGGRYNIVDEHVEQRRYVELVRGLLGAHWVPVFVPPGPLITAAACLEAAFRWAGRRPPLTRHQVERTVWSARFDTSRAARELGWAPAVGLEEALRRTLLGPTGPEAGYLRQVAP